MINISESPSPVNGGGTINTCTPSINNTNGESNPMSSSTTTSGGRKRMIKVGAQRRNTLTTPTNNQQANNATTPSSANSANSSNNNKQFESNQQQFENNISGIPFSLQSNGSSSTGNVSTTSTTMMNSVNSSCFMGSDHSGSPIATTTNTNNTNGMFQRVMTRHASEIMVDVSPKQRNLSKSMRVNPTHNNSKLTSIMNNANNSTPSINTYNKHAIVLAQFCEQKGPSFVYCTQMVNNIHDISHLEKFVIEQHRTTQTVSHHHSGNHMETKTSSTSTSSPPTSVPNCNSSTNLNAANNLNLESLDHPQTISSLASKDLMLHLKKYYPNLFVTEQSSSHQEESDHFNQLLMLSSIEQLTIDRDSEQIFVSSHQESSKFSAHFKTLAIRSTSAEISVGQGREGPVLFGDEINGYNFAYIFKVKDSMARGFARWFAIVLMDTSLSMLTISWPFLNSGMGRIVKLIRARSQQIFLDEKEKQKRSGSSTALNEDGTNAEDNGYRFFHSGGPLSADVFRQKRSKGPMRDLPLLLNYPDFYSDLHTCFSGLLQSFYNKLSEIELNNSNYQKLDMYHSYSIPVCEMPRIRSFISNSSITSNESDSPAITPNGYFNLYSDFSKMLKKSLFNKVLTERNLFINIVNGIELADSDDANDEAYSQSEEMIKSLIHNVLIGNQLVVRSDNAQLRNEVCRLFTTFVPKECIKLAQDSETYVFPYDANFLTVPKQVQITEDSVDFRFVVLLDIEGYSSNDIEEVSIRTEQEYKETTLGKDIEKLFFQTIYTHVQQYSTASNMDYSTLYDIEQNIVKSLLHDWSRKSKFFIQANKRQSGTTDHSNLPIHIHESDICILRYFGSTISLKKSMSNLNMLNTKSTV